MYGDGVNIAARIEPLDVGGGICLSDTVSAQVRNKLEVGLIKLDSPDLKHIEVPMDVYRVVLPCEKARNSQGEEADSERGTGSQSLVTSAATKRDAATLEKPAPERDEAWSVFHYQGVTAR